MRIIPLNDCVLVELIKSDSDIVTSNTGESITRGKVLALSKQISYVTSAGSMTPVHYKNKNGESVSSPGLLESITLPDVGDIVYWRKYADQDCILKADGKDWALIRINDLMGYEEQE